jgi:hypothetical protein
MCLIITQPNGTTLSRAHLLDIHARNSDGFGIMRAVGGVLHTWRTVGDASDMLALYYAHAAGRACVLHWRMATHGEVDLDNAHPFTLTPDIAFVHNGVLDVGTPTRGKSDTWHMARHVLAPIARDNPDALFTGGMSTVLGGMIGTSNKFVIAHADGRIAVINRASGVEHRGCWYSNVYAWDAPASLRPKHTPRYGTWYEDYSTPVQTTCTPCTPDTPDTLDTLDTTADDEFVREAIRAELHEEYDTRGELGVMGWVMQYPTHAVDALCDGYNVTADDAQRHVKNNPANVAEWLTDLLRAYAL